jgi:hypothetical protein
MSKEDSYYTPDRDEVFSVLIIGKEATRGLFTYDENFELGYSEDLLVDRLEEEATELFGAMTFFSEGFAYQEAEQELFEYGAALAYFAISNQVELLNEAYQAGITMPQISDNAIQVVEARLVMGGPQGSMDYINVNFRKLKQHNPALMNTAYEYLIDSGRVADTADGSFEPDTLGDAYLTGLVIAHDLIREDFNAHKAFTGLLERMDRLDLEDD